MSSKQKHEGYLLIDHRNSPGLTEPTPFVMATAPGNVTMEYATFTCNHCQSVVVKNPKRVRERAYCAKCDHYLCDACGAIKAQTGECYSMAQRLDEIQEQAVQEQQRGSTILLTT